MKRKIFLHIARILNEKLGITPLLFGSLGLEERLGINLNPDDIDILIPEIYLNEHWNSIVKIMNDDGYSLYDPHEHAFEKSGISVAFASVENLTPFAGINISGIPLIKNGDVKYYLPDLEDYLKIYSASSTDGYRKNTKNKNDQQKINLINQAIHK